MGKWIAKKKTPLVYGESPYYQMMSEAGSVSKTYPGRLGMSFHVEQFAVKS